MPANVPVILLRRDGGPRIDAAVARVRTDLEASGRLTVIGEGIAGTPLPNQEEAELAIVLGGDGAILRACRQFGERQIPVVGVNLGRLGFLADVQPDAFCGSLDALADGDYRVVEHLMYRAEVRRAGYEPESFLGLNEVVVTSFDIGIAEIELTIDGQTAARYTADGLIVSTPIGSTAHSLSAGGPILRQDLPAFLVTPICPHALTNRPLVDSAEGEYRLRLVRAQNAAAVIDGQLRRDMRPGDEVVVRKASVAFRLIRLPGHDYYATLYRKLGWSGQPRYEGRKRNPVDPLDLGD